MIDRNKFYSDKFKVLIVIVGIIMCFYNVFLFVIPRVHIENNKNAVVIFYNTSELNQSDSKKIYNILSGQALVPLGDEYFCENSVCIKFGEQEFFLDFTGDNVVYYKNKEKFIYLSKIQNIRLHSILKKYGVYFPAI